MRAIDTTSAAPLDFEAVHQRFRSRVVRYLTRLVGEGEAEDLTQSVMLRISEGLADFRGDASLSTWIYRIATNAALDRLRRRGHETTSGLPFESDEADVPQDAQTPSAETSAARDEMNACIRDFIERLPENYKSVMMLSELEGFKNDEIAAILGLNLDTVKIRLHRGRQKLRKDLGLGCSFHRDEDGNLACDRKAVAAITLHRRAR